MLRKEGNRIKEGRKTSEMNKRKREAKEMRKRIRIRESDESVKKELMWEGKMKGRA